MKVTFNDKLSSIIQNYKEKRLARYFKIHDRWSFDNNAAEQLYSMREAIAGYARKNNLKIDIFNPEKLEKDFKSDIKIDDLPELSPHIGLVVTGRKTGKFATELIDSDINKIYPKESKKIFILPINGEENLQVSREIKSTTEDNFLRHVFRTFENMQKSIAEK